MNVAVYAIQPGRRMRRSAAARRRDGEINRNVRICALLPIGDIFEEVFGLSFEACGAEAERVVLSVGVTIAGTGGLTSNTPRRHCIGSNSTR
jgi:hypothetical protein